MREGVHRITGFCSSGAICLLSVHIFRPIFWALSGAVFLLGCFPKEPRQRRMSTFRQQWRVLDIYEFEEQAMNGLPTTNSVFCPSQAKSRESEFPPTEELNDPSTGKHTFTFR